MWEYFKGVGNSAQGMVKNRPTLQTPYFYKDWKWKVYLNVNTLFQRLSSKHWNTNVTWYPHFTLVYLFGITRIT